MSQVSRACGAQYERPGGRERGDRIVNCDLGIGHEGEHEETETGSRWPTAGEFAVPQAAVEAAIAAEPAWRRVIGEDGYPSMIGRSNEEAARVAVEAAAPYIAAAALRQAAEEMWDRTDGLAQVYSAWLRHRADQLDGRQPTPDTREGILTAAGLTEADMAERADE